MKTITIKKYLINYSDDKVLKKLMKDYEIEDIEFLDFASYFGSDARFDNPIILRDFIKDPYNGYFIEEFKEFYNDKKSKTK